MSIRIRAPLVVAVALALLASWTTAGAGEKVALKYKTYRDWKVLLPAEKFLPIKGQISFAGACQEKFKVGLEGTMLSVDTNGDAETDLAVRGKEGVVTLRGTAASGGKFTYSMRLKNAGGWKYAASGAMVGRLGGQKIQLIDQNGNGRYDDIGKDAMIVGRGDVASFLSKVVSVRGKLLELKIAPDGSSITTSPYRGAKGKLDLLGGYGSKAKLMAAVVISTDRKYSFNLSRRAAEIPAGDYLLFGGRVALGANVTRFGKGRSSTIKVADGKTTSFAWGGPITVDFVYDRRGGKIVFDPASVWYYGSGGEQYFDWQPFGRSPEFVVTDLETGKQIIKAIFGGC